MKKLLHLGLIMLLSISLYQSTAQENSGRVIYQEKITIEFNSSRPGSERFREIMEKYKERVYEKELLYSEEATLYRDLAEEERSSADARSGASRGMRWMMYNPQEIIYTEVAEQNVIEQREFMDKKFLIKDSPEKLAWKMGTERKEILGQQCMMATAMLDTIPVEAWFSLEIPVSAGPDGISGLPGMILEVNMNDGKRLITASSIEKDFKNSDLKEPRKGKKVTREEFREIVREKMMEMREERGGGGPGGGHRVIISR